MKNAVNRFKSIVAQMVLAFVVIILLSIFSNSFVYWVTTSISQNFGQLSQVSLPLVKENSELQNNVLKSIAAIQEQIIKGTNPELQKVIITKREDAWIEINRDFSELRKHASSTGYSNERLDNIRELLNKLQAEQIAISDIANTPDNEPALKMLTVEAIPLATSMVNILGQIIELEMEEDVDEDRKLLFKLLADSRNSFSIAISELREFLLTKNRKNIDGFDQAWIDNTDYFVEIFEEYEDYFSEEQLELWELYGNEREKLAPITIQAFELQASPESNFAILHLSTTIEDISVAISKELQQLNLHVKNDSNKSITNTSESVDDMVLTISVSSVLTMLIAGSITLLFSGKLKTRVNDLLTRAQLIATGNFVTKDEYFKNVSSDEFGQLSNNFNNMTLSLSTTISAVKRQSRQVGHSAHQVAAIAYDISNVAKNENNSYTEVMKVTESFMDLLFESSQAVEKSKVVLEDANKQADLGITAVEANINEMNRTVDVVTQASEEVQALKAASEQINSVTNSISEVADQTSLIALNAAIEAARAGEQGRGFAVVADEVRNLAQRTASSTGEIKTVISTLLEKVNGVIDLMSDIIKQVDVSKVRSDESAVALKGMTSTVSDIITSNDKMAESSTQQMVQMQEMQFKLRNLFTSLQQNSEKAQIVSLIGSDLYQTSELVNYLMESFRFDEEEILTSVSEETRRSKMLEAKVKVIIEAEEGSYTTVSRELSYNELGVVLANNLDQILVVEQDVVITFFLPQSDYKEYLEQKPVAIAGVVVREDASDDFEHTHYNIKLNPKNEAESKIIADLYDFFDE